MVGSGPRRIHTAPRPPEWDLPRHHHHPNHHCLTLARQEWQPRSTTLYVPGQSVPDLSRNTTSRWTYRTHHWTRCDLRMRPPQPLAGTVDSVVPVTDRVRIQVDDAPQAFVDVSVCVGPRPATRRRLVGCPPKPPTTW